MEGEGEGEEVKAESVSSQKFYIEADIV